MKNKILTALVMAIAFGSVQFGAGTAYAAQQGQYNQPNQQQGQQYPDAQRPNSSRTEEFFIGTIQKRNGKYVLSEAQKTYQLDKQSEAANFDHQRVQVRGTLALNGKAIHVQQIQPLKSST